MTTAGAGNFKTLCRRWRQYRKLSQLDLALMADVSQRHVSWLETGRSQPSREMVVRLSEAMDIPLRERNTLLQSAGFSAVYRETDLSDPAMAPVLDALDDDIGLYVLELSSFQLETLQCLPMRAAVVLNISADHLDRYESVTAYAMCKQVIYENADVLAGTYRFSIWFNAAINVTASPSHLYSWSFNRLKSSNGSTATTQF